MRIFYLSYHIHHQKILYFLYQPNQQLLLPPQRLTISPEALQEQVATWQTSVREYTQLANNNPHSRAIEQLAQKQLQQLTDLYHSLDLKNIISHLSRDHQKQQMALVIFPDKELHQLPFHLLFDGETYLYQQCAGVSYGLLPEATAPETHPFSPLRCCFFGIPGKLHYQKQQLTAVEDYQPELATEFQTLGKILGEQNVLAFGHPNHPEQQANRTNLQHFHRLGNLFYLASYPHCQSAIGLSNGQSITAEDILDQPWHFSHHALVILNYNYSGKQWVTGREVQGMLAALHSKGARAILANSSFTSRSCSLVFLEKFLATFQENRQNQQSFPRLRAYRAALEHLQTFRQGKYSHPSSLAGWRLIGTP